MSAFGGVALAQSQHSRHPAATHHDRVHLRSIDLYEKPFLTVAQASCLFIGVGDFWLGSPERAQEHSQGRSPWNRFGHYPLASDSPARSLRQQDAPATIRSLREQDAPATIVGGDSISPWSETPSETRRDSRVRVCVRVRGGKTLCLTRTRTLTR